MRTHHRLAAATACLGGLLFASTGVTAAEGAAPPADSAAPASPGSAAGQEHRNEVWVNFGGFSRHFASNKNYNETNRGLGLEYRYDADWSAMAGRYYNSVRRHTTYAAVTYQPLELGPVRVGASLGVMNGYPAVAHGSSFFAALPMATYESKRFGINVAIIPSMPKVDGAVVLQLKMRVF